MAHFTLQVAPHLDYESLTKRVRECQDPIEKNRWLAIQLLNQPDKPMTTQQVAITLNYSAGWVRQQVQYNSSGALAGSANMTFNGTTLTLASDASISGLTVGLGGWFCWRCNCRWFPSKLI